MPLKISVITVCYNSEASIEETICSVINQDYSNIEYIIIDGASNDNTLNIISSFKTKIDILISEKDTGIYDAMNKGIKASTGDIVGILNSDDTYTDGKVLSKVARHLDENRLTKGVYADLFYVKRDMIYRVWKTGHLNQNSISKGKIIPHPTLFLRKDVYTECGLYDPKYGNAADFEFITRILVKYKVKLDYMRHFIVNMKLGGSSNKNIYNIFVQNIEIINILKKYNIKFSVLNYFLFKIYNRTLQIIRSYFQ
tara:strand:+ start:685 stop:1446 length:762 start_codon:yes stop_codon:yes gene_type:complete